MMSFESAGISIAKSETGQSCLNRPSLPSRAWEGPPASNEVGEVFGHRYGEQRGVSPRDDEDPSVDFWDRTELVRGDAAPEPERPPRRPCR